MKHVVNELVRSMMPPKKEIAQHSAMPRLAVELSGVVRCPLSSSARVDARASAMDDDDRKSGASCHSCPCHQYFGELEFFETIYAEETDIFEMTRPLNHKCWRWSPPYMVASFLFSHRRSLLLPHLCITLVSLSRQFEPISLCQVHKPSSGE